MRDAGFTLIELLIVVAIIGIVSAVAVPNLMQARKAAYEANALRFMRSWIPGQDLYKKAHGNYASTDEILVTEGFVSKSLNSDGTADDTAFIYSIDSPEMNPDGTPNVTEWWGRARRRNALLATRSFFIDQSGVIRFRVANNAFVTDPPVH